MKIYKTYLYAFGILTGSLLNASCVDMLTEDPNSYYEKKDIFATKAKAAMAVTGVYEQLPTLYGKATTPALNVPTILLKVSKEWLITKRTRSCKHWSEKPNS